MSLCQSPCCNVGSCAAEPRTGTEHSDEAYNGSSPQDCQLGSESVRLSCSLLSPQLLDPPSAATRIALLEKSSDHAATVESLVVSPQPSPSPGNELSDEVCNGSALSDCQLGSESIRLSCALLTSKTMDPLSSATRPALLEESSDCDALEESLVVPPQPSPSPGASGSLHAAQTPPCEESDDELTSSLLGLHVLGAGSSFASSSSRQLSLGRTAPGHGAWDPEAKRRRLEAAARHRGEDCSLYTRPFIPGIKWQSTPRKSVQVSRDAKPVADMSSKLTAEGEHCQAAQDASPSLSSPVRISALTCESIPLAHLQSHPRQTVPTPLSAISREKLPDLQRRRPKREGRPAVRGCVSFGRARKERSLKVHMPTPLQVVEMDLHSFVPSPISSLSGGPLFLEIFSGDGGLTAAVRNERVRSGPGIDVVRGKAFDLTAPGTQRLILQWIRDGRIWCTWLGTPCSVWCIARKGVRNVAKAEAKDRLGVLFAMFSAEVITECLAHGVLFALENPQSSRLWHFGPIARVLRDFRVSRVGFHACAYGATSQKPTMLAGTLPGLHELRRSCPGISSEHKHEALQGRVRACFHGKFVTVNRTVLGGSYANELCVELARLVASAADARSIPRGRGGEGAAVEEEAPLLRALQEEKRAAELRPPEEINIPQEHLEFVSAHWRSRLVKLGLLDPNSTVHGQRVGPLVCSIIN